VNIHVHVLCICGKLEIIRQLWKFKHTEFLILTTENPISKVSDTKIISSDYGIQVELTAFSK
jgi:hypothetical protein